MLIIFDLDGTLIDSQRDLAISTNATRANFGLPPLEEAVISSYVGNGAAVLVERAMGEHAQPEALEFFLKYYRTHALEHTRLYPGVREAVEALASDGNKMAVLTNKPEKISIDILRALAVSDYFFRVYGGNSLPQKKPDPIGIRLLAAEAGATASRETMMVGDSRVDVETARNAGVLSCGVSWGFQPETFAAAPPDYLIDSPHELLKLVQ